MGEERNTSWGIKVVLHGIFILVVLGLLVGYTNAPAALAQLNMAFFALAALFYIASILVWIVSWAYLVQKDARLPFWEVVKTGFSCVYGAITPIQLGAEALRSIRLKERFNVPYSVSVSASMIVKGIKFFLLALIASVVLFIFIVETQLDALFFASFLSGFGVVVLASLAFLLPINRRWGRRMAAFFRRYARANEKGWAGRIALFFERYADYLAKINGVDFFITFFLAFISWVFEFLALLFTFTALGISVKVSALVILFVLISVLERTPFLPRGIGLVEVITFNFLSFPQLTNAVYAVEEIGALLVAFDFVRILIPSVLSLALTAWLKAARHRQPKQAVQYHHAPDNPNNVAFVQGPKHP
ncbi:MAG: flippase-like domain-containing protein [Candidatus Diapherotrites archaeon]|nr:flippase-like domain-containing protein [Candidatus Diapherotrites archaeon]